MPTASGRDFDGSEFHCFFKFFGTCDAWRVCIRAFRTGTRTQHCLGPVFLFVQLSPGSPRSRLSGCRAQKHPAPKHDNRSRMNEKKWRGRVPLSGIAEVTITPTAMIHRLCAIVSRQFRMTAEKWNNIVLLCSGGIHFIPSYRSHHHLSKI